MRRLAVWVVLVAACDSSPAGTTDAGDDASREDAAVDAPVVTTCTRCPLPGAVMNRNAVPAQLLEASGIVASRAHPGILYAHNDSGDSARVIAFDDQGTLVAELIVTGATAIDWEDIAVGPCPQGSCIYVGDIGDNATNRVTKVVYRFPEPALMPGQAAVTFSVTGVEAFPFSYPIGIDRFHNAETLVVHPNTGEMYVVTKENAGTPSTVFEFPQPLTAGTTATLTKLAVLPFPTGNDPDISGGDIDPCGTSVLLRVGSVRAYVLMPSAGQGFDSAFTAPGPLAQLRTVPLANEANGEAISWNATGTGYFTVGEGASSALHYVACP
jgi:hypothetical protein